MTLDTIKYEKKDAVALIAFNRPEVRNAFNAKMTEDILSALLQAKDDSQIRAIVLTGEGMSFSAGADLSARDNKWSDTEEALVEGYLPSLKAIMEMPKPVIDRVEYDLKDELIRQTIMDTQDDVEAIKEQLDKIDERLYDLQKQR